MEVCLGPGDSFLQRLTNFRQTYKYKKSADLEIRYRCWKYVSSRSILPIRLHLATARRGIWSQGFFWRKTEVCQSDPAMVMVPLIYHVPTDTGHRQRCPITVGTSLRGHDSRFGETGRYFLAHFVLLLSNRNFPLLKSIYHEIALLRQLKHGNICEFLGYDYTHAGTLAESQVPAIITEFCGNGKLGDVRTLSFPQI